MMKEMRSIEKKRFSHSTLLWATMILFTLMIFLGQPQKTQAQWTYTDGTNTTVYKTTSGNVGVGTTSPQSPLHVYKQNNGGITSVIADNDGSGTNTGQAFQFRYGSTGILGGMYHQWEGTRWNLRFKLWTTAGTEVERLTIQGDTGNVGIGTTSPDTYARLHLYGSGGYGQDIESSDNTWVRLRFTQGAFGLYDYTNSTFRLVVGTGGNVGIGVTNPSERLVVSGNINATGNITADGNISAKYQDVAEWVQSSHSMQAGTVVILDPSHSNQVTTSTQSYDTRVAGVVSEHPGLSLGESAPNKVLVATTGRVKVRVDATRSPIHVGDLLVTSDVEGVAMRSEPVNIGGVQMHRPGTLIGKALEPLEHGTGEILVLLSLQ
ncbi:MAG: hypothetical protein AUG51_21750 [Acidobacteria bacterium 13_1_20CM_3_53_8]|nr:MAG: hypothetical protein AUG51_21750 [Acidobacteria bacterium 13_1_20CM_3_53_8]